MVTMMELLVKAAPDLIQLLAKEATSILVPSKLTGLTTLVGANGPFAFAKYWDSYPSPSAVHVLTWIV